MKKRETKLLASRVVNKIGNVILLVSGGGFLYSKKVLG